MGNKESRSTSSSYFDSRSYDSQSFRSLSNRSSFSENYYDHERKGKVQSKYSRIGDDYNSLEQVLNSRFYFSCLFAICKIKNTRFKLNSLNKVKMLCIYSLSYSKKYKPLGSSLISLNKCGNAGHKCSCSSWPRVFQSYCGYRFHKKQ